MAKGTKNKSQKPSNVLVVRFSAIGDVAMTVPSLYGSCNAHPDVRFVFVTRASMVSIFLNAPDNLVVIGVDLKNDYKGLKGMRRLFNELRSKYKIDAVVDLHDVIRTKYLRLLARLNGLKVSRIHKGRKGKHALTRRNNKGMLPLETSRSRYRATFARLGLAPDESFVGLFSNGKASADKYAAITTARGDGEMWVGIAPFAKHQGKIYPVELMEEVVAKLSETKGLRIFLFGGGDYERRVFAKWQQNYPGVKSLAEGKYGFGTELALLSNLDCMVSMDSANMHLASLVDIPVVSIWGATHPYCGFKGWRQADENIIQLPLTCRPCSVFGDRPCLRGDYLCLNGIKPAVVIEKIYSILGLANEDDIVQ